MLRVMRDREDKRDMLVDEGRRESEIEGHTHLLRPSQHDAPPQLRLCSQVFKVDTTLKQICLDETLLCIQSC